MRTALITVAEHGPKAAFSCPQVSPWTSLPGDDVRINGRDAVMNRTRFGLTLAAASFVVALAAAPALGASTAGYDRAPVKPAGISLLIPDDWRTENFTRKGAKKLLAKNPSFKEAGVTVESLLATPLVAKRFPPDSQYADRFLEVHVFDDTTSIPSPAEFKQFLSTNTANSEITTERTEVVGRPALLARYKLTLVRDDGTPGSAFVQLFTFIGPRSGVGLVFGRTAQDDPAFDDITKTMLRSVRDLK
jgi:hypothetical protein